MMSDAERMARAKALATKMETIAEQHAGVILRSAATGLHALHQAIAMALLDAYEAGWTDAKR